MSSISLAYVAYDAAHQETSDTLKTFFDNVLHCVEGLRNGREKSIALTKLEESFMWCGKAIRNDQVLGG